MGDDPREETPVSAARPAPRPGPPTPLEAIFREYGDLVFRTAFRVAGNATDAEDVLQTVFLRLASPGKAERLGAEPRGPPRRPPPPRGATSSGRPSTEPSTS
jgi:hypothetical protein